MHFDTLAMIVVALRLAAGCGGGSSQGELGEPCYPNGTCDVTLACSDGVCVPFGDLRDASVDRDAPEAPDDSGSSRSSR